MVKDMHERLKAIMDYTDIPLSFEAIVDGMSIIDESPYPSRDGEQELLNFLSYLKTLYIDKGLH